MSLPTVKITAVNVQGELEQAQKLLGLYKKAKQALKKRLGGPVYKAALVARVAACEEMIGGKPVNPGQCLPGEDVLDPRLLAPQGPTGSKRANPPNGDGSNAPPPKKPRTTDGPRHRKIVTEDPVAAVTDSISARMLSKFLAAWVGDSTAVEKAEKGNPSGRVSHSKFGPLCDAATDLIDHVEDLMEKQGWSKEQIRWNVSSDGKGITFSDVVSLHSWLVDIGLMTVDIQKKPPVKGERSNYPQILFTDIPRRKLLKIMDERKEIVLTWKVCHDARQTPSAYPGSVEAGLEVAQEVLKNRVGRYKCITCDASGQRGKGMDNRPAPPADDHPYLADCKCPLRGAALELWMIKVTAEMSGIPQRGDDDIRNARLALNPDILKVIAGAIKEASGHEVDTLLSSEYQRLLHTVNWGLENLRQMAENEHSKYEPSLAHLIDKFQKTIKHWEDE
ncbi:hypothetical protein R3P38DRAFT_3435650 [Favolaschia claudopus]|uniref:Uncharacterized protein n=1 Tax=Favolaschia claudopus TaxID=2862362 RepID=A0AAV9ZU21_9AGAR